MKKVTGISIDEELLAQVDERRAIAPGSNIRASRSAVISDLLRKAVSEDAEGRHS